MQPNVWGSFANPYDFFEWVCVAVAYTEDDFSHTEKDVLFRRGGWDEKYTADLLERFIEWCENRASVRTLTYNGAWFDLKLMANWAKALEASGEWSNAYSDLKRAVPNHMDLAKAATDG